MDTFARMNCGFRWGFLKWFPGPPLDWSEYLFLQKILSWTLLFSALGFLTRVSTIISAILFYFLIGVRLSYGESSYDDLGIVLYTIIFAFSSCGTSFSLDSLFRKRHVSKKGWRFFWPLRLMQFVFVSIFFTAGISKLQNGGIEWIMTDTLKHYFEWAHYRTTLSEWAHHLQINLILIQWPWLCKILAFLVLLKEIAAPLALFFESTSRAIIILSISFLLVGFYFTSTSGFINMLFLGGYLDSLVPSFREERL